MLNGTQDACGKFSLAQDAAVTFRAGHRYRRQLKPGSKLRLLQRHLLSDACSISRLLFLANLHCRIQDKNINVSAYQDNAAIRKDASTSGILLFFLNCVLL